MLTAPAQVRRALLCNQVPSWIHVPVGSFYVILAARRSKKTELLIAPSRTRRRSRGAIRLAYEMTAKAGAAFPRGRKYDDPGIIRSACIRKENFADESSKGTKALVGREDTGRRRGAACH